MVEVERSFYIVDDHRGWALAPGAVGWSVGERLVWVRINRDGLRDRDHEVAKPAGTVRVAVLGDSFMEALNVRPGEMFTRSCNPGWRRAGLRPRIRPR